MVTSEVLKLVSLFPTGLLLPTATLPKSTLVSVSTTELFTVFCCLPSSWQPVREMRAATIRREPRLARTSNLAFKGSTSSEPYLGSYGGGFQVTEALNALPQQFPLSRSSLGTRRFRKDYRKSGI